jgi:hypothetical protein
MKCDCCKNNFEQNQWKRFVTYKGLDKHHNPPTFITNFLVEDWKGDVYNLCRDCHTEGENNIHLNIKKILNKNSSSLKFINSEQWIMKKMTIKQIQEAKDEIIIFTKRWIDENGNTKTTPESRL